MVSVAFAALWVALSLLLLRLPCPLPALTSRHLEALSLRPLLSCPYLVSSSAPSCQCEFQGMFSIVTTTCLYRSHYKAWKHQVSYFSKKAALKSEKSNFTSAFHSLTNLLKNLTLTLQDLQQASLWDSQRDCTRAWAWWYFSGQDIVITSHLLKAGPRAGCLAQLKNIHLPSCPLSK